MKRIKIVNFGSLNIDRVYAVEQLVRPGETITSKQYAVFAGGKGLNQSIALARAGAAVSHAGKIGEDGLFLKQLLAENGVDVSSVVLGDGPTGHAIIQVGSSAENAIILFGGENQMITDSEITSVIKAMEPGDYLLLQNEIRGLRSIIDGALSRGVRIILNPAPMTPDIAELPLAELDWLIINQVEAESLTGQSTPDLAIDALTAHYPNLSVILTRGDQGATYGCGGVRTSVPAVQVTPVDTTGAGDTFIGFFVAEMIKGIGVAEAMALAAKAASICVTKPGAADSIPQRIEVVA